MSHSCSQPRGSTVVLVLLLEDKFCVATEGKKGKTSYLDA